MGSNRRLVTDVRTLRHGWLMVITESGRWMLPGSLIDELGIARDVLVDPDEMDLLARREQGSSARRDTERYISGAEHTIRQLRAYLARRSYCGQVIDDMVEWARDTGLVDDGRYAEIYIRSHSSKSPMGNFRLRMELEKRGVDPAKVETILADRREEDLLEKMVALVRSRYGRLEREKGLRRASSFLRRRGFAADFSRKVLERALESTREQSD